MVDKGGPKLVAIGDRVVVDGEEFEVVWDGGEGLVGGRETKNLGFWEAPKRLYNKKSEYWKKPKGKKALKENVDVPILRDSNEDVESGS
jgi:hypothetical protein